MNFDFRKLCGKNIAIYEAYYNQMDPNGTGVIEAMTAAKFLKKSGLSDVVLSRVWDLADPKGNGYLDKSGFYVALKLVSLAQAGYVYNLKNIYMEVEKPPKLGDLPKILPQRVAMAPTGEWSIHVMDRLKYEQLFESLKPLGGMLTGNKVKGVLMESNLPMDTLGKIWDLADQDKDGNLDKHEFIVAMHLVYQILQKRAVPDILPVELRKTNVTNCGDGPPPKPASPIKSLPISKGPSPENLSDGAFIANFPNDIAPPPMPLPITVPPMARVPPIGGPSIVAPLKNDPLIPIGVPLSVADWVVTESDLKRFEIMFRDSDRDKDGLVSGLEVKNVFLQSGVPQKVLAHIWALCDTHQSGKLTLEQFALAMWLVECKQKDIDPPQVLTANMVPPSMRCIIAGVDLQPQEPKPTYSNPELEMISKEIEELAQERRALETEIAQKEADIRIKSGEVRSLQSELDTLSATLKQLEHQRGEAQKRLDDLKTQVSKIREQCQKQEETINNQEGELNSKRNELQKLKNEEHNLQKEYDNNSCELQKLTNNLQKTQLQISSMRSMLTQLLETQRQMMDALLMSKAAIDADNIELVSDYQLHIEPDFNEARKTLEKQIDSIHSDPFNEKIFLISNTKDALVNDFENDSFSNQSNDRMVSNGFANNLNMNSGFGKQFDAFGTNSGFVQTTNHENNGINKDPFAGDTFGSTNPNNTITEIGNDSFGSDPFAVLHAPTGQGQVLSPNVSSSSMVNSGPPPRPESPSPALPPKKSKVPPPRPAPPRPLQTPSRPANPNNCAFASLTSSAGFADFADFDNKAVIMPPPYQLHVLPVKSGNSPLMKNPVNAKTIITSTPIPTITPTALSLSSPNNLLNTLKPGDFPSNSNKCSSNSSKSDEFENFFNINANLSKYNSLTVSNPNLNSQPNSVHLDDQSNVIASTQPSSCILNNKITSNSFASMQPATISKLSSSPRNSTSLWTLGSKAANVTSTADKFYTNKSISSIMNGPTDFNDDPFKDYRYDDPFNIKDPFEDDDINNLPADPNTVFKHDLNSEDEQSKTVNYLNKQSVGFKTSKLSVETTGVLDMQQQFDGFSLNSTLVPYVKAQPSTANSTIAIPSTKTDHKNVTVIEAPIAGNTDHFANFDHFSNYTNEPSPSNQLTYLIKNRNNNASFSSNFLIAADNHCNLGVFNDHIIKSNTNNINTANSNAPGLDAFGIKTHDYTEKTTCIGEQTFNEPFKKFENTQSLKCSKGDRSSLGQEKSSAIENNFEDDFFEYNQKNLLNNNQNKSDGTDCNGNELKLINNIKKLPELPSSIELENVNKLVNNNLVGATTTEDFHLNNSQTNTFNEYIKSKSSKSLPNVQNQTVLTKVSNIEKVESISAAIGKVSAKFADDYSPPENFESDLKEAIKRSATYK